MNAIIEQFTKSWVVIFQFALLLAGSIGGFLVSPPSLWPDAGPNNVVMVARFALAILLVLLVVIALRFADKTNITAWGMAAIGCLALGLITIGVYSWLMTEWSCPSLGDRYVIGITYTEAAKELIRLHPTYSCREIIESAIARTNDVWNSSELMGRFFILSALFFAGLLLCSAAIICTLQVFRVAHVTMVSPESANG